MNFRYDTERTILKILNGNSAGDVLRFYLSNREIFERYEAQRPANFYTDSYQRRVLNYEYNMCVKQSNIRFWVYDKSDVEHVIGTICLRDITRSVYQSCEVGYKFAQRFWHMGYATETLEKCIDIAFNELRLHRIVAHVMPENTPSIKLLYRLGFDYEGIARHSALIRGKWENHAVYSLIAPSPYRS